MTSIKIKGLGGQGIKTIALILAKILQDQKYYIILTLEYDAFVRQGQSCASLIFSKNKIENPITEHFDKEYDFNDPKIKNQKSENMILLGMILKDFNIKTTALIKYLPQKQKQENLKAIKIGLK